MIQHESETLLKPVLETVIQLVQPYKQKIQELEQEVSYWKMLNRSKDERIAELESLVNPYSSEGTAICNSEFD